MKDFQPIFQLLIQNLLVKKINPWIPSSFYQLLQPSGGSENFEKFSQFIGYMKSFKHTRGRISIPMGRTERMFV